jgi:hypothetical protein
MFQIFNQALNGMLIYFTVSIYKEDEFWGRSIYTLVYGSGKTPVLLIGD